MPTYYVEDYDGEKSKDAAVPFDVNAKVVVAEDEPAKPAAKTARAKTKGA